MSYCLSLASTVAVWFCAQNRVDGRCQVQSLVDPVDLVVRSFCGFLRNLCKYAIGSLRKISTEGILFISLGPSWEIAFKTHNRPTKHKKLKLTLSIGLLHGNLKQMSLVQFFKILFLVSVVEKLFLHNISFVIWCYSKDDGI